MAKSARESSRRSSHASDRKRPRSDSDSESDSERNPRDHDRHRRKEKKKRKSSSEKKKKKKKKKTKSSSSSSSSRKSTRRRRHDEGDSSGSSSESGSDSERECEAPHGGVDLERAAQVVRTLLVEFPSISSDLLALLQMLDDGEAAVISGIANARVKTLLGTLFPLLGLKKLRKPEDAYTAPSGRRSSLLETVAAMLTSAPTDGGSSGALPTADTEEKTGAPATVAAAPCRREAPIGPMMPPTRSMTGQADQDDDDDDGDEIVGPALPGMKGYREADERVEAEMARRAKQLEEDEWRRARGEPPIGGATGAATGGRQAWMTEMPADNKIFNDAMGPMMKPRTGQPAAFRSKEPAKIDSTWFDSPEERERAKRAKLDIELLGYVRAENAPVARRTDDALHPPNAGPSVNESILPAANPEADKDMRRQMDALKQKRGPSLLEQHQQKIAEQQQKVNAGSDNPAERSTWNRDRDLTARRGLSQGDADRIINASKEISSKFTAPTVTRQFL